MHEDIEKIKANLILAIEPVWKLPKQQQAEILEPFINDLMKKAQARHENIQTLERVQ